MPPSVLVLTGVVSVQVGAGVAARLFTQIPPAAVTGLRLWTAAALMAVAGARPLRQNLAGLVRRRSWRDAAVVAAFGLTLAVMNYSIYQAFARIPLGIAVTIEFLGPLAVAVAASRRLIDLLWVALAGAGVALLTGAGDAAGGGHRIDLAGLAFALLAGAAW
ncbi:MAG TPA: EamA family transporter, partial [Streptosporangiaceae bacterium]